MHERDKKLGNWFRIERIRRGLRQTDLALTLGISYARVSRIECGEIRGISRDILERLRDEILKHEPLETSDCI